MTRKKKAVIVAAAFLLVTVFGCPALAVTEGTIANRAELAIGTGSSANYSYAMSIGTNASATGIHSIAIGHDAVVTNASPSAESCGVAIGHEASVAATHGVSLGHGATVESSAGYGVALGSQTVVSGSLGIAVGLRAESAGNSSIAIGSVTESNGVGSIALGYGASSGANHAIALGSSSNASGLASIAIGYESNASGYTAIVIGSTSTATGLSSIAIGDDTNVPNEYAIAIGDFSRTTEDYTVSIGREAYTDDSGSHNAITRRLVNMGAGQDDTDAVNVSQLKTMGNAAASALGGASSYSFNSSNGVGTLTTSLSVGGSAYNTIQDALTAVYDEASDKGTWNIRANSGTAYTVGDGGSVNLRNGSNMTVTNDGSGNFTFAVSSTPAFTTVRTGNVTMSSTGIAMNSQKVTSLAAGTISSSSTDAINGSQLYSTNSRVTTLEGDVTGINSDLADLDALAVKYDSTAKSSVTLGTGSNRVSIKNVADGVNANDAVNKGQLDAGIADAIASGKWNLKINDAAAEEISDGKTVTLKDGTNIAITKDASGNYVFSTVAAPAFDSITINNSSLTINSTGINMGGLKITNVQRGDISESSTDAVTGGQLYETNQTIQQLDGLAVKYDNTNKESITLEGTGGTTVTNVKTGELSETSTDAVNGSQLYETNQNLASLDSLAVKYDDESKTSITLGNGTDKVAIKNVADGVDANDAVNKGQLDAGIADAIASGKWNLKINDSAAEEISGGKTVTLKDGTNVTITKDADGNYIFGVIDNPEFTTVTATTATFSQLNATSIISQGITANTISAGGVTINNNGVDMAGREIINLAAPVNDTDAANKKYVDDKTSDLSEDLEGLSGTAVKYDDGTDKTKVTLEGAGGTTITNVKAGELSENSTDAVNGSQLYATNQNLAALDGLAVKYDDESKTSITLGNGADKVAIKNVADGVDANDAVNKGQLDAGIADAKASGKWNLKVNDSEAEEISGGKTVTLKDGTNVSITKDADGNYVFSTVTTPEFDAVTIRNTNISINSTGIDMGGLKITNLQRGDVSEGSTDAVTGGQLYETDERVNEIESNLGDLDSSAVKYDDGTKSSVTLEGADGTRIGNVADGVDANDAVNKGQLDKGLEDTLAAANAKSKWSLKVNDGEAEEIGDGKTVTLKDGTNVSITKDADGSYVFSTVATPEFDAITIRNTNISISSTGIDMGGLKITDLQRGDISEGSTDAVTGGQLHETNQRVDGLESSLGDLDNSAVKYDNDTKSSVTLEGAEGTRIGNVADGVNAKDAVNKGQLDGVKSELEDKIDANVTEINTRIDGVEEDITNLDNRVTVNEGDISNLKDSLGSLTDAAVTYDGDGKSTVTLKGENGTKISNLADGTEDGDAVNLGQLNALRDLHEERLDGHDTILEEHSVSIENHEKEFQTLQQVLGDGYSNPTFNTIKIGNISSDGININMGGGIITGLGDGGIYPGSTDAVTGSQLWSAYRRMDDLQESINVVGAHAAAMSGLHPVPYNPYEPTTLSAAFGTYRDEYAVAVGVFHYVRSNLMFNIGASLCSDGDLMGRAGVSIAIGKTGKKKPELARDMVSMQQQQIQSQYRIQELEAEIAVLKQQIAQIVNAE